MKCPECEAPVSPDQKSCQECGYLTDDQPTTAEIPATIELPPMYPVQVRTACHHVIGKVKPNDQDYVAVSVIDYPNHRYQVILATGADGIGGGTGGERWSFSTVHLFLGAMGVRLPAFDLQDRFLDREQFWSLLCETTRTYFFPIVEWVTGCIYSLGLSQVGKVESTGQPAKRFGTTWTVSIIVCDLERGRVDMRAYCIGDPSLFVITPSEIRKINTDDVRKDGTELDRWVGQSPSAGGRVYYEQFQLEPNQLPYVHVLQCSDGLTSMLSPDSIAEVSRTVEGSDQAVIQLIDRALNVEVPYGQILSPHQDPPYTPADDNIFAGLVSISLDRQGDDADATTRD